MVLVVSSAKALRALSEIVCNSFNLPKSISHRSGQYSCLSRKVHNWRRRGRRARSSDRTRLLSIGNINRSYIAISQHRNDEGLAVQYVILQCKAFLQGSMMQNRERKKKTPKYSNRLCDHCRHWGTSSTSPTSRTLTK